MPTARPTLWNGKWCGGERTCVRGTHVDTDLAWHTHGAGPGGCVRKNELSKPGAQSRPFQERLVVSLALGSLLGTELPACSAWCQCLCHPVPMCPTWFTMKTCSSSGSIKQGEPTSDPQMLCSQVTDSWWNPGEHGSNELLWLAILPVFVPPETVPFAHLTLPPPAVINPAQDPNNLWVCFVPVNPSSWWFSRRPRHAVCRPSTSCPAARQASNSSLSPRFSSS